MATGTAPNSPSSESLPPGNATPVDSPPPSESDAYIASQLRRTMGYVRLVDIITAVVTIFAGSIAYLFVVAVADQWLLRGGFSYGIRLLALMVLLIGAAAYAAWAILPFCFRRINPYYAADTIERASPSLKNSLVNFLFLRGDRRGLHEIVFRSLEQQAATELSHVPIESVVDRSRLIRIGYVMIGVLLSVALYSFFSPKNLLPSVGRILNPAADIAAVTRVEIKNIQLDGKQVESEDGTIVDTEAMLQQHLLLSAEVTGLEDEESVTLFYTTSDRQLVDQPVEMYCRGDGSEYVCTLPEESAGFAQDVAYRIEAGDCISKTYPIRIVAAPSLVVKSLRYKYPSYTKMDPHRADNVGDIKALEGTVVTIVAQGSDPIASATVELSGTDNLKRTMDIDRNSEAMQATNRLKLKMLRVDGSRIPAVESYRLRMTAKSGRRNRDPVRHRIEIIPDTPPRVDIVTPISPATELLPSETLPIEVRGWDDDFSLSELRIEIYRGEIRLEGRKEKDRILSESLMQGVRKPWSDTYRRRFVFSPADLQLKPGDVVSYGAVAIDNKQPGANRTETTLRHIKIIAPPTQQAENENPDEGGEKSDKSDGPREQKRRIRPEDIKEHQDEQDSNKKQNRNESSEDSESEGSNSQQDGNPSSGSGGGETSDEQREKNEEDAQGDGSGSGDASDEESGKSGAEGNNENSGEEQGTGSEIESDSDSGSEAGNQRSGEAKGEEGAEPGSEDEKVDNEGEAFEELLKHLEEKESQEQQQDRKSGNESGSDPTSVQRQKDGQPGEESSQKSDASEAAERSESKESESKENDGSEGDNESAAESNPDGQPSEQEQSDKDSKEGSSDESDGSSQSEKSGSEDGEQSDDSNPMEIENSGDESGEKSPGEEPAGQENSGDKTSGDPKSDPAGDESDPSGSDDQGKTTPESSQDGTEGNSESADEGNSKTPPKSGNESKPAEKSPSESESGEPKENEGSDSSLSQKESDSEEGKSGERDGKGEDGGGQDGNKEGKGTSGNSTPEDEGSGASEQPGEGDSTNNPGDKKPGEEETGKSDPSGQSGKGSESKPGEGSESAKDDSSDDKSQQPGDGNPSDRPKDSKNGGPTDGERNSSQSPDKDQEAVGEDANLDYAREKTDLVLEYLEDQMEKGEPDQELLDKLGWTKEELAQFVRRWQEMKQAARNSDDEAVVEEWDDALRSLGLKRPGSVQKKRATQTQKERGLQSGNTSRPPKAFLDQFKSYRRGAFEKKRPSK